MRYGFTGPDTIYPEDAEYVNYVVAALVDGTEYTSGCAFGVDTIAGQAVIEHHMHRPGVFLRLAVPAALHNSAWVGEVGQMIGGQLGVDAVIERAPEGRTKSESYMLRNDLIVAHLDRLVAFPPTREEELRSGTWATVRRAHKAGKDVIILPLDIRPGLPDLEKLLP